MATGIREAARLLRDRPDRKRLGNRRRRTGGCHSSKDHLSADVARFVSADRSSHRCVSSRTHPARQRRRLARAPRLRLESASTLVRTRPTEPPFFGVTRGSMKCGRAPADESFSRFRACPLRGRRRRRIWRGRLTDRTSSEQTKMRRARRVIASRIGLLAPPASDSVPSCRSRRLRVTRNGDPLDLTQKLLTSCFSFSTTRVSGPKEACSTRYGRGHACNASAGGFRASQPGR